MGKLHIRFHADSRAELMELVGSADPSEKKAGAQLLVLLSMVESNMEIQDRLLSHYEERWIRVGGVSRRISIKIIEGLKSIANDQYHKDAVRRIRNGSDAPGDQYRIFFAPEEFQGNVRSITVLGVYHRSVAYEESTLATIQQRYGE